MSDFSPSQVGTIAGTIVVFEQACIRKFGEEWPAKKKEIQDTILKPYMEEYKTVNLLSAAIRILNAEDRATWTEAQIQADRERTMLLIAACN